MDIQPSKTAVESARDEIRLLMTIQNSNNDRRESLGFAEAVAHHIAPLLIARGFSCTEQTLHSVKFQSSNVGLTMLHEPISYEIELVYALKSTPSERYNLGDLLDTVLGLDHKLQTFFQASERDSVSYCTKAIANYLRKYGEKILIGDPAMYQRIREITRQRNNINTKQVIQQPIRRAAEKAWRNHDYTKVRNLYEPIEDDLTLVEKKRLNYAKSNAHSG